MSDFVDFSGSAERRGDTIRLVAQGNNGTLEFAAQDVRLENDRVAVRQGAVAIAVEEPGDSKVDDRPPAEYTQQVDSYFKALAGKKSR